MDKQEHPGEPEQPAVTPSESQDADVISATFWSAADEAIAPGADAVEASLLPKTRNLVREFPESSQELPYVSFLEHRIQRNPRDLLAHVQRVMQEEVRGDRDGACGALLDLFLVLGKRGRALRERMLLLLAEQLSVEQFRFFCEHLETGLTAADVTLDAPRSRLAQRVTGTRNIVRRRDGEDGLDVLDLAREAIGKRQYTHAQELLEGAVELDPGNADACRELLKLYMRRNQRARLVKMYTNLLGRGLAMPNAWRQLAAEFRAGDAPNRRS